eukprot:1611688-Pleurochrysis_carterae.AAC.3
MFKLAVQQMLPMRSEGLTHVSYGLCTVGVAVQQLVTAVSSDIRRMLNSQQQHCPGVRIWDIGKSARDHRPASPI